MSDSIDTLVENLGRELGYRAAHSLNLILIEYYKELLNRAHDNLVSINNQWEAKELPGDFFTLPYEMDELVDSLARAVQN